MSGTVYRGGWNQAPLSDEGRRTVAGLEARERQAAHSAEIAEGVWRAHNGIADEQQRRAAWEENNTRLALQMAAEEGVSAIEVHRGNWGHTRSEFVALAGAKMDHEDAMAAVRERRAFEQWQRDNAGWEQEPTRAEKLAENRRVRADQWLEERRPGVMAKRAEKAREAEVRRVAGDVVESVLLRLMEGNRG